MAWYIVACELFQPITGSGGKKYERGCRVRERRGYGDTTAGMRMKRMNGGRRIKSEKTRGHAFERSVWLEKKGHS